MKTVWTFTAATLSEKKHGKHPTQKPIKLIERSILSSTDVGDIVLDPFAGSSSTGIAAINNDRHYIGIELESEYVDISLDRLRESIELTRFGVNSELDFGKN